MEWWSTRQMTNHFYRMYNNQTAHGSYNTHVTQTSVCAHGKSINYKLSNQQQETNQHHRINIISTTIPTTGNDQQSVQFRVYNLHYLFGPIRNQSFLFNTWIWTISSFLDTHSNANSTHSSIQSLNTKTIHCSTQASFLLNLSWRIFPLDSMLNNRFSRCFPVSVSSASNNLPCS